MADLYEGEGIVQARPPFQRAGEHCIILETGFKDLRDWALLPVGRDGIALSRRLMIQLGWKVGDTVRVTLQRTASVQTPTVEVPAPVVMAGSVKEEESDGAG